MSDIQPLPEEVHVAEARARLTGSLGALQARLAPKSLAQNAVQGLVDRGQSAVQNGVDTVRKHPAPVAGAIAALGLFLVRKPIARLFSRGDATGPAPDSSSVRKRAVKRNAE